METESESDILKEFNSGRLCKTAILFIFVGIILFFVPFSMSLMPWQSRFGRLNQNLQGWVSITLFISVIFIYLVAPLFGIAAVQNIRQNWRTIIKPDRGTGLEKQIIRTSHQLLITSFILEMTALPPIIMGFSIIRKYETGLPVWVSIWLFFLVMTALAMGWISYKLYVKTSGRILHRFVAVLIVLAGFVGVLSVLRSTNSGCYIVQRFRYSGITETFSGRSNSLEQTVIVPTLDSPCPKNKNIIWCSSFQLAWNEIRDDVIGEPIDVVGAEEIAARLNSAEQSDADLEPESFYAAAGRVKDGIVGKIQKDMATKFPSQPVPDLDITNVPDGIISYSYLTANVPFRHPYRQVKDEFIFTDSNGLETDVGAFGAWGFQSDCIEQPEILYYYEDFNEANYNLRLKEYAIDLCRYSEPYQVVAAVVEPKETLEETLEYVLNKIVEKEENSQSDDIDLLDDVDVLMVPEMFWEIDHRFEELIGKMINNANPPMPIIEAKQTIKLKLDRYGVVLESSARIVVFAIPRRFIFNRPFLIYVKKRERQQPFFVMWIDNAELLNKK